ncbi:MAG: uroporphyrinogen-III synthase [Anaerolineales bacterium]
MKKVLVTRPRDQSAELATALKEAGFEPLIFPVIEIEPAKENQALDQAITQLEKYDWVIFTSVNGVKIFFDRLEQLGLRFPQEGREKPKVAAIGPKTAQAIRRKNVAVDFIPREYIAEAILPGLGELQGKWVLLPRAKIARAALPHAIQQAGGIVHEMALYQTKVAAVDETTLKHLREGLDWITFTSPSTVHHFVKILQEHHIDPLHLSGNPNVACIGPITAEAAQSVGFRVDVVAGEFTGAGLVKALLQYES